MTSSQTFAPIHAGGGKIGAAATGLAGIVGGAVLSAGYKLSKKLDEEDKQASEEA